MSAFLKKKPRKALQPHKVGVALGGGSTLGLAHIGVLRALTESGIPVDYISGTSAGSLVAASFAFGMPLPQMIETSKTVTWKKLSRFGYSKLGLNSNRPMGTFITDMLGDVNIEDAKIPLAIVATNIQTHDMVVLRTGSLHEAIRASTCIPGIFTPVEVDGAMLVDGGLTENVPLTALTQMGATFRIGINLSANPVGYTPRNMLEVLSASFTILSRHRDLHLAQHADVIIEPDLRPFDSTKFKNVEEIIEAGYAATREMVPRIQELLAPKPEVPTSIRARVRSWFGAK